MPGRTALSDAFAAGARSAAPAASAAAPDEATLAAACARGRAAFPAVIIPTDAFATYLGARVGADQLQDARIEDLWVACGAARGDEHAIAAIEAAYFPNVDIALRKMGLAGALTDDVKQGLRKLLFTGDTPRIAEYRGSGDLRAWLRVTAMRAALKLLRKDGRETGGDDAILEARADVDDPELAYMKAAYRASFKAAFQEALESLHPKERTLLKQQIVDGLGIDELGGLYRVHRATAARWVASAREKLLGRTRRTFMLRARISSDECESIMRMVRSQLDVSLHRRLTAD